MGTLERTPGAPLALSEEREHVFSRQPVVLPEDPLLERPVRSPRTREQRHRADVRSSWIAAKARRRQVTAAGVRPSTSR